MNIIERHLPAHCFDNVPIQPTGIVDHYWSGRWAKFADDPFDLDKCWQLMHDICLEPDKRKFDVYDGPRMAASAHYLIGRCGTIIECIPPGLKAWHAGVSAFKGRKWCNNFMVGIENVGMADVPFTDAQYTSNAELSYYLMHVYGFGVDRITGHSDVAPGRKVDPGPLWDWDRLRSEMIRVANTGKVWDGNFKRVD